MKLFPSSSCIPPPFTLSHMVVHTHSPSLRLFTPSHILNPPPPPSILLIVVHAIPHSSPLVLVHLNFINGVCDHVPLSSITRGCSPSPSSLLMSVTLCASLLTVYYIHNLAHVVHLRSLHVAISPPSHLSWWSFITPCTPPSGN